MAALVLIVSGCAAAQNQPSAQLFRAVW